MLAERNIRAVCGCAVQFDANKKFFFLIFEGKIKTELAKKKVYHLFLQKYCHN